MAHYSAGFTVGAGVHCTGLSIFLVCILIFSKFMPIKFFVFNWQILPINSI